MLFCMLSYSKPEQCKSGSEGDQYSLLMNSDVDAFLNISSGAGHASGGGGGGGRLPVSPAV